MTSFNAIRKFNGGRRVFGAPIPTLVFKVGHSALFSPLEDSSFSSGSPSAFLFGLKFDLEEKCKITSAQKIAQKDVED